MVSVIMVVVGLFVHETSVELFGDRSTSMRGIVLGKKEKRLDRHCLLKAGSSVLRMRAVRCQARLVS